MSASICPVCGREVALVSGRIGGHSVKSDSGDWRRCAGSGALAAAGDLFPEARSVTAALPLFTQ